MNDDIFARMRSLVLAALREIVPDLPEEACAKVELTPTRDSAHGDMATNAALVAAASFASTKRESWRSLTGKPVKRSAKPR